jgi:hypothetical protein
MRKLLFALCLLVASCAHAQLLTNLTWTLGSDGIYYPANYILRVGSDGNTYSDIVVPESGGYADPLYLYSVLVNQYTPATNAQGKIADYSTIGTNIGTISSATWGAASNGMSSYYSFGSGHKITYGNSTNFYLNNPTNGDSPFTVRMWVRKQAPATTKAFFGKQYTYSLTAQSGAVQIGLFDAGAGPWYNNYAYNTYGFNDREYAGSYSLFTISYGGIGGTNTALFVNGKKKTKTQTQYIGTYNFCKGTNGVFQIGLDAGEGNDFAGGQISHVRYYTNSMITNADDYSYFWATAVSNGWSNSLYYSSMGGATSVWSNTVAEYLFDYNYPADTSYIGTNHLALAGGSTDPAWRADGTNGYYEFAGDDYLRLVGNRPINSWTSMTFTAWFIDANTAPFGPLLAYRGSSYIFVGYLNNSPERYEVQYNSVIKGFARPATNIWHHFASVWYGNGTNDYAVYIDGIKQAITYHAGTTNGSITQDDDLYISRDDYAPSRSWIGSIDSVILTQSAFTSNQVYNLAYSTTNGHRALP